MRENSPALENVYYTNLVEITLAEGCKDDCQLTDEGEGAEKKRLEVKLLCYQEIKAMIWEQTQQLVCPFEPQLQTLSE